MKMSRLTSNDITRQNINLKVDFSEEIDQYLKQRESLPQFDVRNCLYEHDITANVRARMVDWMIEVLSNFGCDEQTFFIAVSIQDRYFKNSREILKIPDLHIIGVTSMFIASKYEDVVPLRIKTIDEKIAQKKLNIEDIRYLELLILKELNYEIEAPTVLDFLKTLLLEVLGI